MSNPIGISNGCPFIAPRQNANKTRDYFARFWYNRLWAMFIERYEIKDVPETIRADYFLWTLCRCGWIGGARDRSGDLRTYSGTFYDPDVYGFPRTVELIPYVPNAGKRGISFRRTVGKDAAFIRLTPDAKGIVELITGYANQLAQIDVDINVNLENCKLSRVFIANSPDNAQKIRRLVDDVTRGELAVIVDDDLARKIIDPETGKIPVYSTPAEYIVGALIQDRRQVINDYLTAIGVDNNAANMIKAERNLTAEVHANDVEVSYNASYYIDTLKTDIDIFNNLFDTSIKIDYKSVETDESEVTQDDNGKLVDE